jgi:hypothetical protein
MSKENGFLQLRRGIWEHVRNGGMNVNMLAVYVYILSEADTRTGIWKGCAQSIRGVLHLPLSTVKYALSKMDGVYIRRFMVPGRRFCYPILCHKFVLTNGPDIGRMLDAINSKSEKTLAFFPEPISPDIQPDVGRQKRSKKREERKEKESKPHAAKPAAPADPRFQPFIEYAYQSFEAKHSQKPTWNGKDFKSLKALLGQSQTLAPDELENRWTHYAGSTEPFTAKQGDSLAYFCAKFDSFIDGPILGSTGGRADGKAVSGHQERQKRTLEARDRALSRGSRWTDTDQPVLAARSERG